MSPGDSTIHTIRNRLQVLLFSYEQERGERDFRSRFVYPLKTQDIIEQIRIIDSLLSTLDEKVSCPLKKQCPFSAEEGQPQ